MRSTARIRPPAQQFVPLAGPCHGSAPELIGFCGGLNLLSTGILGQYLGRTFLEVKRRPVYIIKEKSGEDLPL